MKTFIFMNVTVDGFIAQKDDDVPFIVESQWDRYTAIAKAADAMIVGRRTYDAMAQGDDLEDIGDKALIVMTKKPLPTQGNIRFTDTSPSQIIAMLESEGHDTVMLSGGAQANTAFLKAGCVDEVWIDLCPHLLGDGIAFADQRLGIDLTLLAATPQEDDVTLLQYAVQNQ